MYTFIVNDIKYEVDDNSVIGLRRKDTNDYYDKVNPFYNKTTGRLSFKSIMKKSLYDSKEFVTYSSSDDLIGLLSTIDILK